MLKAAAALLEPDPRHRDALCCDAETGMFRRIRREDFIMASATNGDALSLLDFIAPLRNHAMHGNTQLLRRGTPDIMRLCADVIERPFAAGP